MEQIIAEHFNQSENFRSFSLIFEVEPFFIKLIDKINFENQFVFIKKRSLGFLFEGIYLDGKKEGLWIYWYRNGQKYSEGYYFNNMKDGLWIVWHLNGQMRREEYRNGVLI